MSDKHRFRHADPKRIRMFDVNSATVIQVGDFVYQATDDIRPASDFTYVSGSLPQTQANFRRDFMGIAMSASAAGETAPVAVASRGTFEIDLTSGTAEIGDRVGVDDNGGATALLRQTAILLARDGGYGEVGKIVKRYSAATTRALVEIDCQALRPNSQQILPLVGPLSTTTSGDLLTTMALQFPFKLVALIGVVTVAYTGTDVITAKKGSQALDDTLSMTGAIGAVVRAVMADATGDDIYNAGDTISLATDGGSSSGTAQFFAEVIPFLHED